jgi:hypothetical protein
VNVPPTSMPSDRDSSGTGRILAGSEGGAGRTGAEEGALWL